MELWLMQFLILRTGSISLHPIPGSAGLMRLRNIELQGINIGNVALYLIVLIFILIIQAISLINWIFALAYI